MRIFYDVDTQNDFMNSDGALYVSGAEEIKGNLKALTEHSLGERIHVLGSIDRHFGTEAYAEREGELARNGGSFQDHCMDETKGFIKIDETRIGDWCDQRLHNNNFYEWGIYVPHTLDGKMNIEFLEKLRFSNSIITFVRPVYFEKQSYDVFSNPATEIVLERLGVSEAVVYGVATDYCVKDAVLGMQKRGIQTYVVKDAIKGIAEETTRVALEEMAEVGARFVTTQEVLEGRV